MRPLSDMTSAEIDSVIDDAFRAARAQLPGNTNIYLLVCDHPGIVNRRFTPTEVNWPGILADSAIQMARGWEPWAPSKVVGGIRTGILLYYFRQLSFWWKLKLLWKMFTYREPKPKTEKSCTPPKT